MTALRAWCAGRDGVYSGRRHSTCLQRTVRTQPPRFSPVGPFFEELNDRMLSGKSLVPASVVAVVRHAQKVQRVDIARIPRRRMQVCAGGCVDALIELMR